MESGLEQNSEANFHRHPLRRRNWLLLSLIGVFLFYGTGVAVRYRYGIAVVIRNGSGERLHDVSVRVASRGKRYPLPDLSAGQSKRVYVEPVGESAIVLEFKDAKNVAHEELLAGYVENDYCGSTRARVIPGPAVKVNDDTFRIAYWKSWLEFIW
jgi:hypothetical protein